MSTMASVALPSRLLSHAPCLSSNSSATLSSRSHGVSLGKAIVLRRFSQSHALPIHLQGRRRPSTAVCLAVSSSSSTELQEESLSTPPIVNSLVLPDVVGLALAITAAGNVAGRLIGSFVGSFLKVHGGPLLTPLLAARATSLAALGSSHMSMALGSLCLAAVRQPNPVSTPLTVVASGMAKWLELYSGVLLVRVLLSWFPNIDWERQPLQAMRDMCDPYLNLFRNILSKFCGLHDFFCGHCNNYKAEKDHVTVYPIYDCACCNVKLKRKAVTSLPFLVL